MPSEKYSETVMPVASQFIKERDYWLNKLSGNLEKINFLPINRNIGFSNRQEFTHSSGETVKFELPGQLSARIMKIAGDSDARLHIILTAGIILLLNKYSYNCNNDIILGVPIYRQNISGRLINTVLALRVPLEEQMMFKDLLLLVNQNLMEAVENQNYPIQALLYQLGIPTLQDIHRLFDVTVMLENIHDPEYLRDIPLGMKFSFNRNDEILSGIVEYHSLTYEKKYVQKIVDHLIVLLQNALWDVKKEISLIQLLSEEEKKQILIDGDHIGIGYPGEYLIHRLWEDQVIQSPNKIAVVSPTQKSSESQETVSRCFMHISYKTLNGKAHQLADLLRKQGVCGDCIVALMMTRSAEMMVGILGVLKSGAAYLPIDPNYPPERIDYMLKDSGANILLTTREIAEVSIPKNIKIYPLEPGVSEIENLRIGISSPVNGFPLSSWIHEPVHSLAYIIYTSGTTGRPKGAMIQHRNVVQLLFNEKFQFDFSDQDTWTLFHSYCFDFSVWEMYGSLLYGGKLIIIPRNQARDINEFLGILKKEKVSVLNITPNAFYTLVSSELENREPGELRLKYVIFGGEALNMGKLKRWKDAYPSNRLVNMYGITETTVHVTYKEIDDKDIRCNISNIGKALPNYKVYIMDRILNLLPAGLAGEICVGGEGVARGYLNQPELTQEKFSLWSTQCPQPLIDYKGSVKSNLSSKIIYRFPLYKSGDLARFLDEGEMEYLGRIDDQVKIRGYRIELGEIESRLLNYNAVKETIVIERKNGRGEKYLCAYIIPQKENKINTGELKNWLADCLPDFMIPSHFVEMENFPLTTNGKINIKDLPEPGISCNFQFIPPRDEVEEILAQIWSDILKTKSGTKQIISMDSDFFQLGGHSLTATLLIARIHKAFNVKVPLSEIFTSSTISQLAKYIRGTSKQKFKAIEPSEEKEYYKLSSAQRRLYVLQEMDKTAINYNISIAVSLDGILNKKKLQETFRELIYRHESLRTSFHMSVDEPVQKIHNQVDFMIEMNEPVIREKQKTGYGIKNFIRPFDLSLAPLMRVGLMEMGEKSHLLIVDIHHIVTDGISMGILMRDLMRIYSGYQPISLRIRYRDFSVWQNSENQRKAIENQQEYWSREFFGEIPVLNLMTDYKRPLIQNFAGDRLTFSLDKEETKKIKSLAATEESTLFMILLALYNILLAKLADQEDIIVGTPIAAREHADLGQLVGMFVNTLALRNFPHRDKTFKDFLNELRKRTLNAFENQGYPFENLVDQVNLSRDTSRNPLFDVMFELQNFQVESGNINEIEIPGLRLIPYAQDNKVSKFDMTLRCTEVNGALYFTFVYCTGLFKRERIENFILYFKRIKSQVIENPDCMIGNIEIIPEEEKKLLLFEYNQTSAAYPDSKTVHGLFLEQAERMTDRIALIGLTVTGLETTKLEQQLTYRELNERVSQLAYHLIGKGVKPDTIVAILGERSIEMIVGVLGILKAGGGYLPIDPAYPEKRINYMLEDSKCRILLTASEIQDRIEKRFIEKIDISGFTAALTCKVRSSSLAYIIYTSGSSGKPKGVMIEHRSVVNRLYWMQRAYPIGEDDVIIQKTPFVFDVSVWELFWWSWQGSSLCLLEPGGERSPESMINAVERYKISIIHFVPSMFYAFLQYLESTQEAYKLNTLRCVFSSGEALGIHHVEIFNRLTRKIPRINLINLYGPTEATVDVSFFNVPKGKNGESLQTVPIGKPIDNIRVYILDKIMQLQPIGLAGELFIAGVGLARGYSNRPELTLEKYFQNPYVSREKIYCTGDLAIWSENKEIEFLGRFDHQLKIRGFRIEMGEIEGQLLAHEEIKEAAVVAEEEEKGGKFLCAYIVSDNQLIVSHLREYMSTELPDYMIPSYFVRIERIPLTINGKLDRKALPAPVIEARKKISAPGSEKEKKLESIWKEILSGNSSSPHSIGLDDNFFELGGHSVKAIFILARIHKEMNVKLSLADIFKNPTLRSLAKLIPEMKESKYPAIELVEEREYYNLSSAQKRLYILYLMETSSMNYNRSILISLEGNLDKNKFEKSFEKLVMRHESLRTSFRLVEGEPVQKIYKEKELEFNLEYHESGEADTRKIIKKFFKPFHLEIAPIFRVGLVKTGNNKYILMVETHHIISDGISNEIIIRDFKAFFRGENPTDLKVRYKDFSQFQNKRIKTGEIKMQEEYWLSRFPSQVPSLKLPLDYQRKDELTFLGSEVRFEIDTELTAKVKNLVSVSRTTMFMVLLSVYSILLSRYSGQEDIVIGAGIAGRQHADLENIMGMFVNMLAIRTFPSLNQTYKEFLEEVKKDTLDAYNNQDYQFDELVLKLGIEREIGRNPIFDTQFTFQNIGEWAGKKRNIPIPGLKASPFESERKFVRFDLSFTGLENGDSIIMLLLYKTGLFKSSTIEKMTRHYIEILNQVLENNEVKLQDIKLSHEFIPGKSYLSQGESLNFEF